MNEQMERRIARLDEGRDSLERFLGSPLADYVIEYLKNHMLTDSLLGHNEQMTAYNVGRHSVVAELEDIQKRARGEL
jgi:hypothetical protein